MKKEEKIILLYIYFPTPKPLPKLLKFKYKIRLIMFGRFQKREPEIGWRERIGLPPDRKIDALEAIDIICDCFTKEQLDLMTIRTRKGDTCSFKQQLKNEYEDKRPSFGANTTRKLVENQIEKYQDLIELAVKKDNFDIGVFLFKEFFR